MSERSVQSQPRPRHYRDAHIEALRLLAIVGISTFHVFLPWYESMLAGDPAIATAPWAVCVLGCIDLLGTWGNHVFFLISGFFLVPRLAASVGEADYWSVQWPAALRRGGKLLATVAFWWVVVAVALPFLQPDAERSWLSPAYLATGLEFVWVYLVVILVSPVLGWLWARLRMGWLPATLVVAVFVMSAYVAFVSPGSSVRGLLEWRKLLSAVTYLASFYVGAAVSDRVARRRGSSASTGRLPEAPLLVLAAATVVVMATLAWAGRADAIAALSYKSTSLLSFALAVACVYAAGMRSSDTPSEPHGAAGVVCALSPSVIGFYVLQALTWTQWNAVAYAQMQEALLGSVSPVFFVVGLLIAVAVVAAALALDMVLRRPLFALVGRSIHSA